MDRNVRSKILALSIGAIQHLLCSVALATPLSSFHQSAATSSCPVAEYNFVYNSCRAPACGDEQYDNASRSRETSSSGTCGGFNTDAECAPLRQGGETMASCSSSCTTKSKLSKPLYCECTHTGNFFKVRNRECQTEACGVQSQTPKTYSSCRSMNHEIDQAQILLAMDSGRGVDRASALLAIAVKETTGLPEAVRKAISDKVDTVSDDTRDNETKLDRLRVLLLARGDNTSIQDIEAEWVKPIAIPSVTAAIKVQAPPFTKQSVVAGPVSQQQKAEALVAGEQRARVVLPSYMRRILDRTVLARIASASPKESLGNLSSTANSWDYSGYTIGYGLNSASGEAKGSCLLPTTTTGNESGNNKSKIVRYSLDRIEDYQSLLKSLFAQASFSVTAGFGKANASAQFSQTFQASENSMYLLAKVEVSLEEQSYDFPDLKPAWTKIQNSGEPGRKRFFDGCGDRYVRGMRKGANFVALYQLLARDESEKQNLKASFSGGSATGAFSGSAEFTSALERVHRFTSIQVKLLSLGYPGGTIPDTPEAIVRYAQEFPDKVTMENAYPVTATTGAYTDFPSYSTGSNLLDARQRAFLAQADLDFEWLLGRRSVLNYAKSNESLFDWDGRSKTDIVKAERNLVGKIDSVAEAAELCFQNSVKCKGYDPVDRASLWIPKIRPRSIVVGGCSGKLSRFGNYNGGCLDTSSGVTWSAPSSTYWTFSEAVEYCRQLTENDTRGWRLASIFEVAQLKSPGGAAEGFATGSQLNDWFWASDGASPAKGQRVNIDRGTRKEGDSQLLKLRAICRQA